MSKRAVSFLCVLAMCLSLLSGISVTAADTYSYTMLQGFESADAADDSYTFSQNQSTGNVLTYTNMTNTRMAEVTVSAVGMGADNFYPRLSGTENDWSGYDGLMFYYAPVKYTSNNVGRLGVAVEATSGGRYATANQAVYFIPDGATEETMLESAADGRHVLPKRAGYIRVPFASLAGFNKAQAVKEVYLDINAADFVHNVYRFDDVKLYKNGDSDYLVLQDFEGSIADSCYTFTGVSSDEEDVLACSSVTVGAAVNGNQYSRVTVSAANEQGDNFYPRLPSMPNDWTEYHGIYFYYEAGACPGLLSNGLEVGRMDILVQMKDDTTRYIASNTAGPMYFLEDGKATEVKLLTGGDQRYILPNTSGYIRMPFTSLVGWDATVDMTQVKEFALWLAADSYYVGNSYYFDAFQLYICAHNTDDSVWNAATCTTPKTCSVCKAVEGTALGHKFETNEEVTCLHPADCTRPGCGATQVGPHAYVGNTCSLCAKQLSCVVNDCASTAGVITGGSSTTSASVSDATPSGSALAWHRGTDGVLAELTVAFTGGAAEDEALMLYVDATEQKASIASYTLHFNMDSETTTAGYYVKSGAPYYFVGSDGTVTEQTFVGYTLSLLKDARGWIIVPVSSINGASADNLTNLYMNTGTTFGSTLYVDEVGFAADTEALKAYLGENVAALSAVTKIGSSVNEAGTSLRFGFTLTDIEGVQVDGYLRDITNATITLNGNTYKLVDFGAILCNQAGQTMTFDGLGKRTIQVVAEKIFAYNYDAGEVSFACGIKNIPSSQKDTTIYARSYLTYSDGTNVFTVYGAISSSTVNESTPK